MIFFKIHFYLSRCSTSYERAQNTSLHHQLTMTIRHISSLEAHTTLNTYNLWKLALRGHLNTDANRSATVPAALKFLEHNILRINSASKHEGPAAPFDCKAVFIRRCSLISSKTYLGTSINGPNSRQSLETGSAFGCFFL